MNLEMDYSSPNARFTFDLKQSPLFKKDHQNFINVVGRKQLNTLKNISLLDTYLGKNNIVEPHYHQNADEVVYCISGSITVSILHPFSKQLMNFTLTPGQIVNIPRGWWHYIVSLSDHTHFLAIFDAPNPEVTLGSDILKFTPANIIARTYCLNENQWKQVVAPIKPPVFIGPAKDCHQSMEKIMSHSTAHQYAQPQYFPLPPYPPYW